MGWFGNSSDDKKKGLKLRKVDSTASEEEEEDSDEDQDEEVWEEYNNNYASYDYQLSSKDNIKDHIKFILEKGYEPLFVFDSDDKIVCKRIKK